MAWFENFPYVNFHELNLDWILQKIKELNDKFDDAIASKITFADPIQWDITKAYEALTIVMNDDKAYLSMQPVPPGTLITNTDYWQNIFDLSELYDEIDQLRTDLEAEIETLDENTVKNNASKTVLWIGDSYSTWNSGALFTTFVQRSGLDPDKVHNLAVSGAGFVSDGTTLFINQVQGYTGDRNAVTDIVVCGGINDAKAEYQTSADITPLTNAIEAFVTYCAQNYPNAKIHVAYVGGTLPTSTYYSSLHPQMAQEWALWAYTVFAGGQGCNVLKTWNVIHLTHLNYNTDGLHPNNTGSLAIGETVAAAFNNINIPANRPRDVIFLRHTGVNVRDTPVYATIINDTVLLETPDNYIQIASGQTIGYTDWLDIYRFESCMIRTIKYYQFNVLLSGFSGMTQSKMCTMLLKVEDGVISMKIFSINANNQFETFTAASFSAITFFGIPEMNFPVWQMN